jgi:hypothetical protein
VLFQGSFNGSYPSNLLLEERFGMPSGFIERRNSIFQRMNRTALLGDPRKDIRHCAATGVFPIGEHAFHRSLQWLQQSLDFLQ